MALILRCRNGGRASSEASPSSWRLGATLPRARRACARVRSVISDVTGRALYTGAWGDARAAHKYITCGKVCVVYRRAIHGPRHGMFIGCKSFHISSGTAGRHPPRPHAEDRRVTHRYRSRRRRHAHAHQRDAGESPALRYSTVCAHTTHIDHGYAQHSSPLLDRPALLIVPFRIQPLPIVCSSVQCALLVKALFPRFDLLLTPLLLVVSSRQTPLQRDVIVVAEPLLWRSVGAHFGAAASTRVHEGALFALCHRVTGHSLRHALYGRR